MTGRRRRRRCWAESFIGAVAQEGRVLLADAEEAGCLA